MTLRSTSPEMPDFYPRPPRGGRLTYALIGSAFTVFLSTPSARRATYVKHFRFRNTTFLSTPSARRATKAQWT